MKNKKLLIAIFIFLLSTLSSFGQGLEIYLIKIDNNDKEKSCTYCTDSALIKQSEIKYFDWDRQIIELTESASTKLEKLKVPLSGLDAVITINKKPIYKFSFWAGQSSIGCEGVLSYISNNIVLEFGLPKDFAKGNDPRFNPILKEYLIKTKLIK